MKKLKILISASGTGGHLIPAQMLASRLQEKKEKILFAAADLSTNALFDKNTFPFQDIPSSSIKKKIWKTFLAWTKGLYKSLYLLRKYQPDVVVGFGSYHTFPVLLGARILRIPIVLFEPNYTLGKVNWFFAKSAKRVAVQFSLEKKNISFCQVPFLPWKTVPKLFAWEAKELLGLEKDCFTFLVFGGSQGADFINESFMRSLENSDGKEKIQVIHLTGSDRMTEKALRFYREKKIRAHVQTFEKQIFPLFIAADFVVCRAGASTLGELITFEKPALLIPYPFAHGHQEDNGRFYSEVVKGGYMILQKKENERSITALMQDLLKNREKLFVMQKNIQNFKLEEEKKEKKSLEEIVCEVGRRDV
ncbi:MAG: UDP-N-acetylglucosamine--N-acetylmuramyl-(pentapeptide) pyrophosphoryl-undecaprenol N-acetylglucosamine transferase [Chlamydiota bacterium]